MNANVKNETNFVQYLITGRLPEKGRLVLPEEFRDEQNLKAGSPIAILKIGNSLWLPLETEKFNRLCERIEQILQTLADRERVGQNRHFIRHASDAPIVLAAINDQPDWIITKNRDYFIGEVTAEINLRIASPVEFFEYLVDAFDKQL